MISQASNFHKQLLDHLNVAVILVDGQFHVAYLNPAAEMLLGLAMSKAKGHDVRSLVSTHDSFSEHVEDSRKSLRVISQRAAEWSILSSSEQLVVDYSITPISGGSSTELLIEVERVDRWLKITKEEAMQAAHSTSRSITRGIAHEIKNPLGGIIGAAQLLERESGAESLHEFTEIIISEAHRLRRLVDRMLGPRKPPKLRPCNIHEVLEHVKALINTQYDQKLEVRRDYDPSIPEINIDREQIIQAVLNLCANAAEAISENQIENGVIILRTRVVKRHRIEQQNAQQMISIEVIDNGPGVPKKLAETLFYPMVSGSASGSGLGLSITQSIVHQHLGTLEYRSVEGNTTFAIYLPLEDNHDNT